MRLLIPIILAVCFVHPTSSQKPKPRVNTTALLAALKSAVGEHLEVTKHELVKTSVTMGSETYWLVFVKPKHSGYFDFKYRYKYNQPLYSHVEKRYPLRVGKQGCFRGSQGNGYYGKFCLGDTIILPIVINRFTEHTFKLEVSEMGDDDPPTASPNQGPEDVSSPVAKHLRLVKSWSYKMLHRAGGYTLERYATFEAREPGRFNLTLSTSDIPPTQSESFPGGSGGTAIIVVPRDAPLTLLVAGDHTTGYTIGYNGEEYESSTGGDTNYVTNVWIVQTGDTIELNYGASFHPKEMEYAERQSGTFKEDRPDSPPKVFMSKFSFDPTWSYNSWIKDYLPTL